MIRREHFSTALAMSQGIVPECLALFDIWEPGMSSSDLFSQVQQTNALNIDSERRMRNIVIEGFSSRFLRKPHDESAPALKMIFARGPNFSVLQQIIFIYAYRQHGIFFSFLAEEYWPAIRAGRTAMRPSDVELLIDRALVSGLLEKRWSESMRERVTGYVLGISHDLGLLGPSKRGSREIQQWMPSDQALLYLAYDLHFLGASDDEVADSEEWQAFGLLREDVTLYLNRLQTQGHMIVQDTGHLCRIDWKYSSREELAHVLIS